jgi:hypothetical protein
LYSVFPKLWAMRFPLDMRLSRVEDGRAEEVRFKGGGVRVKRVDTGMCSVVLKYPSEKPKKHLLALGTHPH